MTQKKIESAFIVERTINALVCDYLSTLKFMIFCYGTSPWTFR